MVELELVEDNTYKIVERDLNVNSKPILVKIKEDGCWDCISHPLTKVNRGYPFFKRAGKSGRGEKSKIVGTRYIYFLQHGRHLEDGLLMRHTCDNRLCLNPEHLLAGTQWENMEDMMKRNRGNASGYVGLKPEVVREIKIMLRDNPGITYKAVGEAFGVTPASISKIAKGRTWKNLKI